MSMTGFGRAEVGEEDFSVTVEVRSVNNRFLDVHVRCPAKYAVWETRARALVREAVSRGKVDLFIGLREWESPRAGIRVNKRLLSSLVDEVRALVREFGLSGDLAFRDLLAVPDLVVAESDAEDLSEARWPAAERAVRGALGMLRAAREEEGARIRATVSGTLSVLREVTEQIFALSAENKEAAAGRFRERIERMAGEAGMDPGRLAQEAAILLDRLDITEECERLRAHFQAAAALIDSPGGPVGKRFDFLLQEIFRELNTASAKSAHAGISARVVEAKTELEKVREQIHNVE